MVAESEIVSSPALVAVAVAVEGVGVTATALMLRLMLPAALLIRQVVVILSWVPLLLKSLLRP